MSVEELNIKVEYDRFGRMKYNPNFHRKVGTPWTTEDLEYLIGWYKKIGADEMSFALERPITSVMQKVNTLRKKGYMKASENAWHKRTYSC